MACSDRGGLVGKLGQSRSRLGRTRSSKCTQQDVKKMPLNQAKLVYWKKWAAKRECEELKDGVWLEPIQAMLRRMTTDVWTDKHRNVARKVVVGGGWVQKRLHVVGWSIGKKCRGCNKEKKRHKEAQIVPLPVLEGGQKLGPRKMGQTVTKGSKKDWKW